MLRRFAYSESGQAIVEIALFTPLLLFLLIAAIDLGRYAQFDTELASSARAGAQYGAVNLVTAADSAGMTTAAKNDVANLTGITVTTSNFCKCADGSAATCTAAACPANHRLLYVSVTANGTFKPLFRSFLGSPSATPRSRTVVLQVGQ